MGYMRLVTHPAIFTRPLTSVEATANVEGLLGRSNIQVPGEGEDFWRVARQATLEVSATGNLVPAAHLVALMRKYGVSTIWTGDRDFRKFDGIHVRDPFVRRVPVAPEEGFGLRRPTVKDL
jgi:predicted nucleic acid-binding protein